MKRFASVVSLLVLLCLSLTACGKVKTSRSAEDYVGENYETVVSELEAAGFTSIELVDVPDLTSRSSMKDGDVSEVSIDGSANFEKKARFAPETPIEVTYHTIKKLEAPLSSDEAKTMDVDEISEAFSKMGYKPTSKEVFDLDPDEFKYEFENEVRVNDVTSFAKGEGIPFDAAIEIVCHKPYQKFDVKVIVDFVPNWIFSTYGVVFSLGEEKHTLAHGEDAEYTYRLREGTHTLTFTNSDDANVKGEVKLDVHSNVEASFQIFAHHYDIGIETVYVNLEPTENQVKILSEESDFRGKNYEEVTETLRGWGFTQIQQTAVKGASAEANAVTAVTIDGADDYKAGDIVSKDVSVVISYCLKDETAPEETQTTGGPAGTQTTTTTAAAAETTTQTAPATTAQEPGILTAENCPELAAILALGDDLDPSIAAFAEKYHGKTIAFDGCILDVAPHGSYKTRFDVLIGAGDYNVNSASGPNFHLTDVNYYDMNVTGSDSVQAGLNMHITANVGEYKEMSALFELDIISMEVR